MNIPLLPYYHQHPIRCCSPSRTACPACCSGSLRVVLGARVRMVNCLYPASPLIQPICPGVVARAHALTLTGSIPARHGLHHELTLELHIFGVIK